MSQENIHRENPEKIFIHLFCSLTEFGTLQEKKKHVTIKDLKIDYGVNSMVTDRNLTWCCNAVKYTDVENMISWDPRIQSIYRNYKGKF